MAKFPNLTAEQRLDNERTASAQLSATLQSTIELANSILLKEREDRELERLWILMFPGEGE